MTDLWDLEAEMSGASRYGPEWDAKVERARTRVAGHTPAWLLGPCDKSCLIPEVRAVALRPFD